MTITLEKIKGMNIPVGVPIEISLFKGNIDEDHAYKEIGYFKEIVDSPKSVGTLKYTSKKHTENNNEEKSHIISYVDNIIIK